MSMVGLAKANEECGELVQVIGKLMSRPEGVGWEGEDLYERLNEEVADVIAAINFLIHNNPKINRRAIWPRINMKLKKFLAWHELGQMG